MKVMLIIWADPRPYLALLFTAQMLTERGVSVDLVYRTPTTSLDVEGEINCGRKTRLRPIGRGHTGWRDKIDYTFFIVKLITMAWREKPDVVIGYNKLGLIASFVFTRIYPKARLIYHNFDFDVSTLKGLLSRLELYAARRADLTIFPAQGRSTEYKKLARLERNPISVLNCFPLKWTQQKTGELQKILESKGLCFDRLVVRLGMIGPFHGIKATIRSMVEWKGNWGLIMGGFAQGTYLEELHQLVEEFGLGDRVIILPSVSSSLWYDILYSGDLGICLYEPNNLSHTYMAGTSQKLNNYFVAGIPSIVPRTRDFESFVEQYGTSKMADVEDPSSIAQAVNSLLCDPEEYAKYCCNVRKAFESEFNYEKQFEPILNWIVNQKTSNI